MGKGDGKIILYFFLTEVVWITCVKGLTVREKIADEQRSLK